MQIFVVVMSFLWSLFVLLEKLGSSSQYYSQWLDRESHDVQSDDGEWFLYAYSCSTFSKAPRKPSLKTTVNLPGGWLLYHGFIHFLTVTPHSNAAPLGQATVPELKNRQQYHKTPQLIWAQDKSKKGLWCTGKRTGCCMERNQTRCNHRWMLARCPWVKPSTMAAGSFLRHQSTDWNSVNGLLRCPGTIKSCSANKRDHFTLPNRWSLRVRILDQWSESVFTKLLFHTLSWISGKRASSKATVLTVDLQKFAGR